MTGYGKSAGSDRTSATSASTPPAEAPATTTAWPRGRASAGSGAPVTSEQHYSLPVGPTGGSFADRRPSPGSGGARPLGRVSPRRGDGIPTAVTATGRGAPREPHRRARRADRQRRLGAARRR